MVNFIEDGICGGEWESQLGTHEFGIAFFEHDGDGYVAGQWAFVDIVEYGEWFTLFPKDAREHIPAEVVEEIDAAIAKHIATAKERA